MRAQVLAALEESLTATPDPGDVWIGVQAGIDRRHRRNRYYRTGIAVALVLAVSLLAASISAQPREHAPIGIPVGEWKNSIRPTWLPDGLVAQEFTATLANESITYQSPNLNLFISIGSATPVRPLNEQGWDQTEISGRPAHEYSVPGLTILDFQLTSGRWAEVRLSKSQPDDTDTRATVREPAQRVARSLEETGDLRLSTKFAPTYLPNGQRIVGVGTNIFTPAGFGSIVCTDTVPEAPNLFIAMTNVAVNKDLDATARIADIQGRQAYRSVSGGAVFVADFHGGTLAVGASNQATLGYPDSEPALVPLSELIKIAEGVRWVG